MDSLIEGELYSCVAQAFEAKGPGVANSVLRGDGDRPALTRLPIDLPQRSWRVVILTLKNRTLSPVLERFIECAREVAKSFVEGK